jgi:hypothetical protein
VRWSFRFGLELAEDPLEVDQDSASGVTAVGA